MRGTTGWPGASLDHFLADVVAILRDEVAELVRLGATYIQIDASRKEGMLGSRTLRQSDLDRVRTGRSHGGANMMARLCDVHPSGWGHWYGDGVVGGRARGAGRNSSAARCRLRLPTTSVWALIIAGPSDQIEQTGSTH